MIVDEQIQSYRISFELTKPNHSNLALLVPWSFLWQLRLWSELMERVHMNVWHQRWTANHNTEQVWFTSHERASEIQISFAKGWDIKVYEEFKCIPLKYLSMNEDK